MKIDWEHEHKVLGCYSCKHGDQAQVFRGPCCSKDNSWKNINEETGECLDREEE